MQNSFLSPISARKHLNTLYPCVLVWLSLSTACTSAPLPGTVQFRGTSDINAFEDYVLDDGWTVNIDQVVSGLTDLRVLNSSTGEDLTREAGVVAVEHSNSGRNNLLPEVEVEAGPVNTGFATSTPTEPSFLAGGPRPGIIDMMAEKSYVHWVEGSAIDPTRTSLYRFAWGLPLAHDIGGCSGISVLSEQKIDVAVHLELRRLFTSDFNDPDAPTQFQAYADADTTLDRTISIDELIRTLAVDVGLDKAADDVVLYRFLGLAMGQALSIADTSGCTVVEL